METYELAPPGVPAGLYSYSRHLSTACQMGTLPPVPSWCLPRRISYHSELPARLCRRACRPRSRRRRIRCCFAYRDSPLTQGTGLRSDVTYGCNLVGSEFDTVAANGASPPNLHILATTTTHSDDGTKESSNTTYYVARSGALVFASGSIYSRSIGRTHLTRSTSGTRRAATRRHRASVPPRGTRYQRSRD